MKANSIYIVFIFIASLGCGKQHLTAEEYVQWVNNQENGIHTVKQIGNIKIDVLYTPLEYIIIKEARGKKIDSVLYKERKSELAGMDFFTLRLSDIKLDLVDDPSFSQQEINERLYYFSYAFQNDIALETNGKLLPCQIFHFERSYDLTPVKTFMVGFEREPSSSMLDRTLVLEAKKLGIGKVKIFLESKKLEQIPLLQI